MMDIDTNGTAPQARWDGRRVLFEVQHDMQVVPCAVMPVVIRELAPGPCFKTKDVLKCFMAARSRIEAAVHSKLQRRTIPYPTPLTVWSSDLEDHAAAIRMAAKLDS
ncbi:DUF1488 family protein [Belnapia rosea]|uniref:Uncharacterized protein n=1 Tax=Belnapia rosea TaxID=938405 RepID=A0A1G6UHU0_9PROT|nr:DUF1488 family protein [Belnapia rosea]SDD40286.1 Protein of unknown function [Belnapia rosea]